MWCAAVFGCWLAIAVARAQAQDANVPIALQVELLARLLWYERGLQKDPSKELGVLVIERRGDADSQHTAAQLSAQLGRIQELGGKVVSQLRVTYESAQQVGRIVDQRRPYLIYLSKGLRWLAKELVRMQPNRALLIVSTDGYDASEGVVLGFELQSSKPRIVLSLKNARAQKLDFSAQVLRVVRVVP
jgi:YfiR/HmsC-like